jgi:aspartyl-tRNA(Asn)/glutamyl-tRNA(Gln) amidotransferase subunit A
MFLMNPPMEPSTLTIAQAQEKFAKKEISALELTKSCIDRIEEVDPALNAVVHKNFERAQDVAKKTDSAPSMTSSLNGIPYLAKDVFCEKGVPTTGCSNVLRSKEYCPPFTSTTIRRLEDSGAVSIGKANTDEFTMGSSTETSCYGVTKNPWDTSRVAGGSSGGPAAAVAADECLFALGTDTGGSIRQPASFCGCTGLKVTYGRTSRYGVMSYASSLDSIGVLTKTVLDAAIVLEQIAGKDPLDATTGDVPVPEYRSLLNQSIKGLKIGLPKEYFAEGLDTSVEGAVVAAAKSFKDLGATLHEISLPHTNDAIATYYVIAPCEVSSNMARYDGVRYGHTEDGTKDLLAYYEAVRSRGFGPEVKRRIMIGTYALSAGYYDAFYRKAQKVRTLIRQDFTEAFKEVDVILAPVAPTPAFKIGAHTGDPLAMYLEDVFTVPINLAGIPSLALPCGFSPEGLPIGMQLMGPQWGEETILRAGYQYQMHTDWHTRRPPIG